MSHGVHPVIYWESKVTLIQFDQGLAQKFLTPTFRVNASASYDLGLS